MPAFLDTIAGAGWVRGCLPVLKRLGQSIPQFLFADFPRAAETQAAWFHGSVDGGPPSSSPNPGSVPLHREAAGTLDGVGKVVAAWAMVGGACETDLGS